MNLTATIDNGQLAIETICTQYLCNPAPETTSTRQTATGAAAGGSGGIDAEKLKRAARRWMADNPGESKGNLRNAAFNLSGHLHSFALKGSGQRLNDAEVLQLLKEWNCRNADPLRPDELIEAAANGRKNGTPREDKLVRDDGRLVDRPLFPKRERIALGTMIADPPEMREPIIEGILRRGEVGSVIAAAKKGKSWFTTQLVISAAAGVPFLGYPVKRGPVLIVDAELHVETLANRYHSIALAMGVPFEQIEQNIGGMILRGDTGGGLERLMADLADIEPGSLNLVILDARYRFTEELDENSNRDMTLFHNLADQLAVQLDSAVMMIHHSSKGTQSHKDVVDVGSGAGSQARAVDSHLVIRDHEESDCSVLDAAVRSWPPMRSRTIRFDFPLWQPEVAISPQLKQHHTPHEDKMAARLDSRIERALEVFEQQTEPISKNRLRDLTGLNNDQANKVLVEMLDRELLIASRGVARNKMEIDLYELATFEGEQLDSDVDGIPSEMNRTPSDSVSDGTEYPGTE